VLDAGGDDVTAGGRTGELDGLGGAPQRHVVGLGAAAGEDHLGRLGADEVGHGRARLVQQRLGPLAEVVDTRGVAEVLGERAGDGLDDRRVGRGRRVVVKVATHLEIWKFGNVGIWKSF
jgi:hypothetical protein